MNSGEHQNLVNIIRGVHQKLRKNLLLSGDANDVWTEHLKEHDLRKKYSLAMFKLASEVWSGKECRIQWTYSMCLNYFYGGGLERSIRRQMKLQILKPEIYISPEDAIEQHNYKNLNRKLKLLDVGSCYNPFSKYEEFDCVAIDLTPATSDVLECDYLNLQIKACKNQDEHLDIFCGESFDIVVLSLVLEYLPSPLQRLMFCYKSWQLLRENGLCIIITPDSKSVHHNVPMMKSWKLALETIGFLRIKYDKLKHLHCMAFRKIKKEIHFCWNLVSKLLFIPQDFNQYIEKERPKERSDEECNMVVDHFGHLPSNDVL